VVTAKLSRELGRSIHRVFELRQNSDYGITPPLDKAAVEDILKQAAVFVSAVKQYLTVHGWM
jgi:uncharacterized protein (UPF0332 family)